MNTKKILIIAAVALASIAAGYGLIGLRPAGSGSGAAPETLLGAGDGTPRVVYLDDTASIRDGDDGWSDDDRYENERDEGYEAGEREDGERDGD